MWLIGLSGGIASGKSTVSRELHERGLPIIDADKIAHAALRKGTWGWMRVVATFGRDILRDDGEVNRARLGEIVFADGAKRKQLNSALGPAIALGIFWQVFKHWIFGASAVVLDAPLLFEARLNWFSSPVIVVWVDNETEEARLIARDGLSKEQAQNRIKAQIPLDQKRAKADIVIDNSGSLEETREQIDKLWPKLVAPSSWKEFLFSRGVVALLISMGVLLWHIS